MKKKSTNPEQATNNVNGFKGFDKGLSCRGYKFEENKTFEEKVTPSACNKGFHFCELPLNVFNYYPPKIGAEYAEVTATGEVDREGDKTCTNKLSIKGKLSLGNLFKAHFDIVYDKVKKEVAASDETVTTAGNYAHANTAGNYAHANTAGNEAHANTAGYKAHANTAGNYAHANTAGYKAHANTAGNEAHANTAGNYAHANTAGEQAIACSLGYQSRSKASKGWIIITDWRRDEDYNYSIHEIYRAKVGEHEILGTKILPDVAYWMEDGVLKSEA